MPECGEEATQQHCRTGDQDFGDAREHQQMLLDRIPLIPDVQSSWALVFHCTATLENYYIRVLPRVLSDEFATFYDNALLICVSRVLVKSAGHAP